MSISVWHVSPTEAPTIRKNLRTARPQQLPCRPCPKFQVRSKAVLGLHLLKNPWTELNICSKVLDCLQNQRGKIRHIIHFRKWKVGLAVVVSVTSTGASTVQCSWEEAPGKKKQKATRRTRLLIPPTLRGAGSPTRPFIQSSPQKGKWNPKWTSRGHNSILKGVGMFSVDPKRESKSRGGGGGFPQIQRGKLVSGKDGTWPSGAIAPSGLWGEETKLN